MQALRHYFCVGARVRDGESASQPRRQSSLSSPPHMSPPTPTKRQSFSRSSFLCLFTGLVQRLCACVCVCTHARMKTLHIFIHQLGPIMIQKPSQDDREDKGRAGKNKSCNSNQNHAGIIFSVEEDEDTRKPAANFITLIQRHRRRLPDGVGQPNRVWGVEAVL